MRAIRRMEQFKDLPIIAVTGKAGIGERERCVEAGANDYVAKPVESTELLAALKTWLPSAGTTTPALPVADPPTTAISDARPEERRMHLVECSAIEGTKILVVDDDFRNIFAMSALLERGHADVTVAESGAEAITALERAPDIDIVLMDIMMPVMDGYETIRAIRTMEQFASLPIIAVTGRVMAGERQRCIDAGASDYVPKPVDTAELLSVLRPWMPVTAASPA
jgi:CheY-like chemotaxis protein